MAASGVNEPEDIPDDLHLDYSNNIPRYVRHLQIGTNFHKENNFLIKMSDYNLSEQNGVSERSELTPF